MVKFFSKKILQTETLGDKLKRLRQDMNLSIEEVAGKIHITAKYLDCLEKGLYEKIPGEVYRRQFLKTYAAFLEINPERAIELYEKEQKVYKKVEAFDEKAYLRPPTRFLKNIITPKKIRWGLIILAVITLLVYFGLEAGKILSAPELILDYPPENYTTDSRSIEVAGHTEPEAQVFINGQEIFVDKNGHFSEVISLNKGINAITVSSRKKGGKESSVSREVLAD